ncbi:MAG: pantoate--beta-alanine ligase [Planctomycetota bacterium]|nr:MAG: pantoate--beta-alanine ligase [Planctomycetota bacterium]
MQVVHEIQELRAILRRAGRDGGLGLVPTMGALHEGHLSLLRRARKENRLVAASIFVNPLQFGENEDFAAYPRHEEQDLAMLESVGCDLVLVGQQQDLYPEGFATEIRIDAPFVHELEGAQRPGHFNGVATVVSKLFLLFSPTRAYFGLKDLQQLALVQQLVRDLGFDLEIVPCEVVREADGLALSSRNRFLNAELRAKAPRLQQSLQAARALAQSKGCEREELEALVRERLEPDFEVEYVDVRSVPGFLPVAAPVDHGRIVVTARLGGVRLLDNLELGEASS